MITLTAPRTANEALRQARTAERALDIIAEGYSFWPDAEADAIAVCKPGFLHADYWLTEGGLVCDCPACGGEKMYSFKRGWIDAAGRTRTWIIVDPGGQRLAEVTTRRAACALVEILSRGAK